MKRFLLILALLVTMGLPALAQAADGPIFAPAAGFDMSGTNFSPYYPAAYRGSCGALWQRQHREDDFLRQHQWRERQACSGTWGSGRCRNLGRHERREWEHLHRRQRAERARWGCY